jgi:hypothetical protein
MPLASSSEGYDFQVSQWMPLRVTALHVDRAPRMVRREVAGVANLEGKELEVFDHSYIFPGL